VATLEPVRLTEKDDGRRGAHKSVMAGEGERAGFPIDAESGDGVAPLIARAEEIPCGSMLMARGKSPLVQTRQPSSACPLANGKNSDTVVQPVGGVHEPPVGREVYPEAKLVPVKPLGRVETVCLAVSLPLVLSKSNNTSVEPCSCSEYIRCSLAKTNDAARPPEAARPTGIIGRERAVLDIELPNKDLVQRQVGTRTNRRRISLHHMRVRSAVVAENGKFPRGALVG